MIKLIFCLNRKQGISRQEFDRRWRDVHGPLVRKYADALRIKRYVQSATLYDPRSQEQIRTSRNAEPTSYDGVAEIWWDSLEELAAARLTPEGSEAGRILLEDEAQFIDLASSRLWYSTERVVVP